MSDTKFQGSISRRIKMGGSIEGAVTEAEEKAAENGSNYIKEYNGPVEIVRFALQPIEGADAEGELNTRFKLCDNDNAFFKSVMEVMTPDGATAKLFLQWSMTKIAYGPKRTLFTWLQVKAIMAALGMEPLRCSQPSEFGRVLEKYFGGLNPDTGEFEGWAGLKFNAHFGYKKGTFHIAKLTGPKPFVVVDEFENPVVFHELSLRNEDGDLVTVINSKLSGINRDEIKAIAAANSVDVRGTELLQSSPIEDLGDQLLHFSPGKATPVAPIAKSQDPHTLVKPKVVKDEPTAAPAYNDPF